MPIVIQSIETWQGRIPPLDEDRRKEKIAKLVKAGIRVPEEELSNEHSGR